MADILTHVFRTCAAQSGQATHASGGQSSSRSVLLVGDRGTSRSVLLLAALSAASQGRVKVLFFTRTQIQSLPRSAHTCRPALSPANLQMIKFCYPQTVEELLQQVASLHEPANTSPTAPSLIIVDRLQSFLCTQGGGGGGGGGGHQGEQSRAAHLSALLHDTAAFLTQLLERRTPGLAPCRLLASFQSEPEAGPANPGRPDPVLAVLDRYFPVQCRLERAGGYLEEVWRVILTGTTEGTDRADAPQEWQLVVSPDGLIESSFYPESKVESSTEMSLVYSLVQQRNCISCVQEEPDNVAVVRLGYSKLEPEERWPEAELRRKEPRSKRDSDEPAPPQEANSTSRGELSSMMSSRCPSSSSWQPGCRVLRVTREDWEQGAGSRWNALSCSMSQWSWGVSCHTFTPPEPSSFLEVFSSPTSSSRLSTGAALEAFGGRGGEGVSSERTSTAEGHSSEEKNAGLSHRLPLVWLSHSYGETRTLSVVADPVQFDAHTDLVARPRAQTPQHHLRARSHLLHLGYLSLAAVRRAVADLVHHAVFHVLEHRRNPGHQELTERLDEVDEQAAVVDHQTISPHIDVHLDEHLGAVEVADEPSLPVRRSLRPQRTPAAVLLPDDQRTRDQRWSSTITFHAADV
ncbi:ATPase SWSAP1 [Merluccius polli]|uniref:ATPase SWSAP1 n=1 Tax=Merluccius polli TaxID=89951 RepID=A0AA47ND46_MERPO|nr:ATPase SWSAP1 [Merluccius polli]